MSSTSDRYHALTERTATTFPPEVRARAARELEAGRLVALPTETIYGLAARADSPEALAALARAKGVTAPRAWTWHVGSSRALLGLAGLTGLARRLAERYWPGPLTLVVPGAPRELAAISSDGWIGLRQPAHEATAAFLESCAFPVVMTSANPTGKSPLAAAAEIHDAFSDVAFVVDAGPPRLGEASAVLRVGPGAFDLLRAGLFDLEQLRQTAGRRLAFCCTGNTCRSPMAEGIAVARIAERLAIEHDRLADFGFHVSSMGIAGGVGLPVSMHSVEACAAHGIDIAGHRSRPATPASIADLDELYGLTHSHVDALRYALPPQTNVAIDLLDPEGRDIPDPIGGSLADYQATFERIERAIQARLGTWV